jgi:hypothetical protein
VLQIWNYPYPQGYRYRQHGNADRRLEDREGLALVKIAGKEAGDTRRRKARARKRACRDSPDQGATGDA